MTELYFEEFAVGAPIEHERRRPITESDNQRVCDMTMNQQPLHLDSEFAADTAFDRTALSLQREHAAPEGEEEPR